MRYPFSSSLGYISQRSGLYLVLSVFVMIVSSLRNFRGLPSRHSPTCKQALAPKRNMASGTKFDINSKYRMNSGHEIPVLGYGVYQTCAHQLVSMSKYLADTPQPSRRGRICHAPRFEDRLQAHRLRPDVSK